MDDRRSLDVTYVILIVTGSYLVGVSACSKGKSVGGEPDASAADECTEGALRCAADGLTVESCNQDAQWRAEKTCDVANGAICDSGRCTSACDLAALSRENRGCEFFPTNLLNSSSAFFGVVASNPSPWPTEIELRTAADLVDRATIEPGGLHTFRVPGDTNMERETSYELAAFRLTSTLPVAAYQFSPLDKADQRSNDASILLPTSVLGRDHYLFGYEVTGVVVESCGLAGPPTVYAIVGTEDDTQVTVQPTAASQAGGSIPAMEAGVSYSQTIDEMGVLQFHNFCAPNDPTGTRILSDKPVAVFAAHACADIPTSNTFCDHLQEQMIPVQTWGHRYLAANFRSRSLDGDSDTWRVMAANDDTSVQIGSDAPIALAAGEFHVFSSALSVEIVASKPVGVAHYMHGQGQVSRPLDPVYTDPFETTNPCNTTEFRTGMGDPSMLVMVPTEQFRTEYAFLTPNTYAYDFVTLTTDANKDPVVELDGEIAALEWNDLGLQGSRYAHLRVGDGPHTLAADRAFGIEVHGYDCNVSYAYTGGMNLEPQIE